MRLLREVIAAKGAAYGAWSILPNAFATELLARDGYDWMCVDCQHGLVGSIESLMPLLQVMNRHDVPAFVRIPWKTDFNFAMYALDYGAQGIVVPMVDTPDEAAAIAAAIRYAPVGERSFAPVRVSFEIEGYSPQIANDLVCCLIMIETRSGLEHLEEILAVPGVDGVYIGPSDLLIAHGGSMPPNPSNALLCELADRVVEACRKAGKIAGIHNFGPENGVAWVERGFQLVPVSEDAALIRAGSGSFTERLAALRAPAPGGPQTS
ncbi:MAG TPA: aldolase/citrate lyase family protein [Acidimicrobiales bacterium]|nr:aldolase/citrate lyase family protein [Acidimicrobiales bacterium]